MQNTFAKFALVAALCAAVPMLTVTNADARGKRGDTVTTTKKFNGGKTTVTTTTKTKGRNKTVVKKTVVNKYIAKPANKYIAKPAARAYNYVKRGVGKGLGWGGKRFGWGNRGAGNCVAVGKTIRGHNIPGVFARKFGPRSCMRAMNDCRNDLARRKNRGLNPYGRCVVVSSR